MTLATTALDGTLFGPDQPCFGCSPDHPFGFRLKFRIEEGADGREVVTDLVAGDRYQGPPGVMHGGLVAALADEVAAWAVIDATGKFGFTAKMTCSLKRPVRIGTPLTGRGRVTRATSRIVDVRVTVTQGGEDAFVGELSFVLLDRAGAEKLLGGPLPESWSRFAR